MQQLVVLYNFLLPLIFSSSAHFYELVLIDDCSDLTVVSGRRVNFIPVAQKIIIVITGMFTNLCNRKEDK